MLGALTAAAVASLCGVPWTVPPVLRSAARPVVGVLIGGTFTASVVASMPAWWSALALVLALSLAMTVAGFAFFRAVAGYDRATAFFAASPAGIAEMSLFATTLGGNVRAIVIVHLMRIIAVLFAVPFVAQLVVGHPIGRVLPAAHGAVPPDALDWAILSACAAAGFLVALRLRFGAGTMVFPLILSAAVHAGGLTDAVPPAWLVAGVQVVIGGVIGARFAGLQRREVGAAAAAGIAWAAILIALALAVAAVAAPALDQPFLPLLLAIVPGGAVEMSVLAYSIGLEVAFVVTCQVCRIVFVTGVAPVLLRAFDRRRV